MVCGEEGGGEVVACAEEDEVDVGEGCAGGGREVGVGMEVDGAGEGVDVGDCGDGEDIWGRR